MHVVIDWNLIVSLTILGLLSFVARQLWSIKLDIKGLLVWKEAHEKLDENRHRELKERIEEVYNLAQGGR